MEPSVFERILAGELPADVVYEDQDTLAFLNIAPTSPGHTLVIPKKHSRNIFDIDEASWLTIMRTVRLLAPAIQKALNADGINIDMNNEPAAGQVVFHTHVHIIPRHLGDGLTRLPAGSYGEESAPEIAKKIRKSLA